MEYCSAVVCCCGEGATLFRCGGTAPRCCFPDHGSHCYHRTKRYSPLCTKCHGTVVATICHGTVITIIMVRRSLLILSWYSNHCSQPCCHEPSLSRVRAIAVCFYFRSFFSLRLSSLSVLALWNSEKRVLHILVLSRSLRCSPCLSTCCCGSNVPQP